VEETLVVKGVLMLPGSDQLGKLGFLSVIVVHSQNPNYLKSRRCTAVRIDRLSWMMPTTLHRPISSF
jgi:hypothetical protein